MEPETNQRAYNIRQFRSFWFYVFTSLSIIFVLDSCVYDQFDPIVIPRSDQTENLEAFYVNIPPNTLNSAYWSTADYVKVDVVDITTQNVNPEEGFLNMNGMYNGLEDFRADTIDLTLKAAYDDEFLYILTSWTDERYNASQGNWLYDGAEDNLKPGTSSNGWTSQRNDDNLIFSFGLDNSDKDVWKWSLALSEPLGFAIDMLENGQGIEVDAGDVIFSRNIKNPADNGSGPMYEWDGTNQELERELVGFTLLDPGYYLLNKMEFLGDVVKGDQLYQEDCATCHGIIGDGEGTTNPTGVRLNVPANNNRISREGFDDRLSGGGTHSGSAYWNALSSGEQIDVVARLRGFSGVPGYYLDNASGSFPDIKAYSNVNLGRVDALNDKGYKVLLIRPLTTNKSDDIQFTPETTKEYEFSIFLTDNDSENLVGSISEKLLFKSKK